MIVTDIAHLRLINQQIIASKFKTAKEIVGWMGAMQAQDYNMAKWAVGVRLPGSTEKSIDKALDEGEIFRTHLLRPTWHFVSSDDIYWMLALSAPQIKAIVKSRDKILGIHENTYEKTNFILENALRGNNHLTREELALELETANIETGNFKASHYVMRAEIDGIICNGKRKSNTLTYALLSERVPTTKTLTREEALSRLAQKYFTSHCPATLQDFVWWSGLSLTESKQALESIKPNFVSEKIDNQTYWFANSFSAREPDPNALFLLPAYDEFIISYKDRTASLPPGVSSKAVSNNGVFRPTIVINGQVAGIWKRVTKKDKLILETEFFQPVNKETKNMIEDAAIHYEHFVNKKVELVVNL